MLLRTWAPEVIRISFPRRTVARTVGTSGHGLHSGVPVAVTFRPAEAGIRFFYGDDVVTAAPEGVTSTIRSTSLGCVRTVEHLMSALSGLGITDIDIHLDAPEVPAMDGSSAPFCDLLISAGFLDLGSREAQIPDNGVTFSEGAVEVQIAAGSGKWQYWYQSDVLWPHDRVVAVDLRATGYREAVACARTFVHEAELPTLADKGLGKGLDRSSLLVVGPNGYTTAARMPDEAVTHKLLDLMGDLYLTGIPALCLDVSARRSGHRTNVAAAALLTARRREVADLS